MPRFYDVTLQFKIGSQVVQPVIRHVPADDPEEAGRKALATSTAKIARHHGHEIEVVSVRESTG